MAHEFTVESEDWTIEGWAGGVTGETDLEGRLVEPPMRTVTLTMKRWDDEEPFRATLFKSEAESLADHILRCFGQRRSDITFAEVFDVAALACRTWGEPAQRAMISEEIGEFLAAFSKLSRDRATREQVIDEAADVIVVLGSAMALLGGDRNATIEALGAAVKHKVERLRQRLEAVSNG